MSVFSAKLVQFAANKKVKMYQVAERCGIDRSTVYQIFKGDRQPGSLEVVSQLARALQLDPTQTEELSVAYKISRMGDLNYSRRQKVLEFFNSFCPGINPPEAAALLTPDPSEERDVLTKPCGVCVGEEQVNAVVRTVVESELARRDGLIQIMAQPEYQFLFQILCAASPADGCKIQHILCLENSEAADTALYNLRCLKTATDLLLAPAGYTPFYYYDNVNAHFRNHMLLPYAVITGTCAVQISYDLRRAVYYSGKEQAAFFRGIFDEALKRSTLMVKTLDTISDSLEFYLKHNTQGPALCGCNAEPCLIPYLDRTMLEKYAKPIDNREELLEQFVH